MFTSVPELPEVETIRQALDPLLRGRTVVESAAHPSPKFASAPAAAEGGSMAVFAMMRRLAAAATTTAAEAERAQDAPQLQPSRLKQNKP